MSRSRAASGRLWRSAASSFLVVVILFGALYSGYFFFSTVRALVARVPVPFADNIVRPSQLPGRLPEQELPDMVVKKERVNILLLGIDQRPGEPGPFRTDTMILVSIDPATHTAALLSIPRDLWVTIPGYGENRINVAHFLGDARDYPGGGVALAKKTVWHTFGVPVHYYVRINFAGFERLIDAIGGVTIDVERPIRDNRYPTDNYGVMSIYIPAGIQQMDGVTALQYARTRHGSTDFDRMARQQQVLMAVRDKMLSLDLPLSAIPQLLDIAGDTVQTDLSLEEMRALAEIAKQIDRQNIRSGLIDGDMTISVTTPQGWVVEVPDWSKVRPLVDDLFPPPDSPASPTPSIVRAHLAGEGGRIELRNGTLEPALSEVAANALRDQGFNVVRYGDADRYDYQETVIVSFGEQQYPVEALAGALSVPSERVRHESADGVDVDIVVVLGREHLSHFGLR